MRLLVVAMILLGGCAPEGWEYVPCATRADCAGPADCRSITWRGGSGNLCTAGCGVDRDCPHSGRCLDPNGSGTFECFEACHVTADCPTQFVCQTVTTGGAICLPGAAP